MDVIPKATPNTKGWSGDPNSPGLGEITNLCIDGIASAKKAAESVLPSYTTEDKGKTLGLGEQGPGWVGLQNPTQELLTVSGTWVAPSTGIYQVELQGGGGGGGGLKGTVHFGAAAPGQAGEYRTAMLYYTKSQEIPYTIGAGGSASVNNGGTGGGTVFDSITARGGAGGIGGVISASAGYILTGLTDTSVRGAIGRLAHPFFFPSAGYGCEGIVASYGADTVFGTGGRNSDYVQKGIAKFIYGTSGSGYGASGSGALACSSGDVAGGAGKQGCVRITLLVAFGE